MPVRFRQAPGLPPHKEIIDLSGHWHMLIINMKVKLTPTATSLIPAHTMKLALLGAKIGPNLFAVIPPNLPPSSCVSGSPKALSHPATRGESHAAQKPVPAPKASVAEDFPRKLVGMIKISVCYELPSP